MAPNAGFGIVVEVAQDVINRTIAAYWSALDTPLAFELPSGVEVAGESIGLAATLQLLSPNVTVTANPHNLITANFGCGGFLGWSIGATPPTEIILSLSTTIDVGIVVADTGGYLVPSLDLSNAVVANIVINVVEGAALPSSVNQALSSPVVLGALQSALRAIPPSLLSLGTTSVPDSITASGVTAKFGNVVVVPLNGNLIVAADLIGYTTGNAAQLVDLFSAPGNLPVVYTYNQDGSEPVANGYGVPGYDANVAATINGPALMAVLNGPVTDALTSLALPGNASISGANFSLGYYQRPLDSRFWPGVTVEIDVSDVVSVGSITINFGVYAEVPGSGTTAWLALQGPGTWFFVAENVTIDISFVVDVLAVTVGSIISMIVPALGPIIIVALVAVLAGVVPTLITEFESEAKTAINAGLSSSSSFGSSLAVVKTGSLPGASAATLTVTTTGLVISSTGIDSYATVEIGDPSPPVLSLTLNGSTPEDPYVYDATPQSWNFQVVIPAGALNQFPTFISLTDPAIHVAWSVSGPNINSASFAVDQVITQPGALTNLIAFNPNDPAFVHNNGLTVTATLYRILGSARTTLWTASIATTIGDLLDITQWYVTWAPHRIYFSTANNQGTPAFYWTRLRHSVLHKTNRVERCKNVNAAALAAMKKDRAAIYSNSLPFPAAEAPEKRRGTLCDYCFFGGPHGTTLVP